MTSIAITGTIAKFMSLADGTIRYMIDVPREHDLSEMHRVGQVVALAFMKPDAVNRYGDDEGPASIVDQRGHDVTLAAGSETRQVVPPDSLEGFVSPSPSESDESQARRRSFANLSHTAQMALLCKDQRFWRFMSQLVEADVEDNESCAEALRCHFMVESRSQVKQAEWLPVLRKYEAESMQERYGDAVG